MSVYGACDRIRKAHVQQNFKTSIIMEATIRVPEDFEEAENCFLVNFSHGQLLPSALNKPKFTLYQKTKDRTKKRRVMVAEMDHLSYVGTNYDPDSTALLATANCRYCIGALDRETGVMTLHKTQHFTLKPHIPGKTDMGTSVSDATTVEEQTPSKPLDYRKSVDQMVNLFGSEKQKRAFSAAKRNVVDEGELDAALATAVSHVKKEVEDVVSESVSMQCSGLMPPHNPAAEAPQDVYDIEDIISLGEFKVLKKAAKVFTKATAADISRWREEKRYPEYCLQHIHLLPTKDPQKSLKAAMLLYALFLCKMHNMSPKALEKEGLQFEGVSLPEEVKEQLLLKFTERQEGMGKGGKTLHTLSHRMKDKIRLHLFVLTLIVDDFTVNCLSLQQDLKLTTTKVMDHFRALGCVVTKTAVKRKLEDVDDVDSGAASASSSLQATSSCTAVLKIPLNFPNPRKGKRRN